MVRMYSSSPPPLDEDGEEEDEDDFGEFGGYCCGVSSSFSFSESDAPTAFHQSYETDTTPPDLYKTFTQSVRQPGKDLAIEEKENITKDQEVPCPESLGCQTDVPVDCGKGKLEISEVLLNGPLSSDSQGELSVVPNTGKHSTSKLQDFKLGSKAEHSDNPDTDQVGYCLSNGPITLCAGEKLEWLTVTSTNSTESVLASRAEDSCTETDQDPRPDGCIVGHQLLEDNISHGEVSEARDTVVGEEVTQSQEVDSNLSGEEQSSKEKMEKEEMGEDALSGLCGPSGASFCEIQIQSGSEEPEDVAHASLAPVVENNTTFKAQIMEKVEDCNETSVSPVVKGALPVGVPGGVELEEDFEEVCLPVVDPTVGIVQDTEADLVIREVERIVPGNSVESDEDFGDFRDAAQGFPDVSQTESMSQEGFADFVTALSDCSSHDEFADADTLKDLKEEDELVAEDEDDNGGSSNHEMVCSELPPSDSFADFSSAPFGGLAGTTGESWAEFGQHKECEVEQETWAAFDEEQQHSTATAPSTDGLRTDNVLVCWGNLLGSHSLGPI